MKRILTILTVLALSSGCMQETKREAIERKVDDGVAMLKSAMEKAAAELSSQSAGLIASGAVIEPGYEIEVFGGFGPTFYGRTTIKVIGASATMGASTQMGPPNRNVETFGESKLPPIDLPSPVPSDPQ
jgi:hypothetical protein